MILNENYYINFFIFYLNQFHSIFHKYYIHANNNQKTVIFMIGYGIGNERYDNNKGYTK